MKQDRKEYMREYQLQWIKKRREEWIEANGPCPCGSSDRLEVDHIDPAEKTFNPSGIWSRRAEIREKELAKCQVLCYDCHKNKTIEYLSGLTCGTHNAYASGCRCDSCREAQREYNRKYRRRIAGE